MHDLVLHEHKKVLCYHKKVLCVYTRKFWVVSCDNVKLYRANAMLSPITFIFNVQNLISTRKDLHASLLQITHYFGQLGGQ